MLAASELLSRITHFVQANAGSNVSQVLATCVCFVFALYALRRWMSNISQCMHKVLDLLEQLWSALFYPVFAIGHKLLDFLEALLPALFYPALVLGIYCAVTYTFTDFHYASPERILRQTSASFSRFAHTDTQSSSLMQTLANTLQTATHATTTTFQWINSYMDDGGWT